MLDLDSGGGEGGGGEGETETKTGAETEDDVPMALTRSFAPFLPAKAEMVDSWTTMGVHPELEWSHSFLGISDQELPMTAHSMISAVTIEERPSTTDVGTQSERESAPITVTANAGTQSDETPAPLMAEMGTQFDPELENVPVPMVEKNPAPPAPQSLPYALFQKMQQALRTTTPPPPIA